MRIDPTAILCSDLTSLIYAEKIEFENPAIIEYKQCKQTERFSVMAKGSDYVIKC